MLSLTCRFEQLHRHVMGFPAKSFNYIGIDDEGDTTEHYAGEVSPVCWLWTLSPPSNSVLCPASRSAPHYNLVEIRPDSSSNTATSPSYPRRRAVTHHYRPRSSSGTHISGTTHITPRALSSRTCSSGVRPSKSPVPRWTRRSSGSRCLFSRVFCRGGRPLRKGQGGIARGTERDWDVGTRLIEHFTN